MYIFICRNPHKKKERVSGECRAHLNCFPHEISHLKCSGQKVNHFLHCMQSSTILLESSTCEVGVFPTEWNNEFTHDLSSCFSFWSLFASSLMRNESLFCSRANLEEHGLYLLTPFIWGSCCTNSCSIGHKTTNTAKQIWTIQEIKF